MVAVREAVEVERLREDRGDLVAPDVRRERGRVRPHLGIGRTQIGEVPVPERVLCGAFGVYKAEPVVVQEDYPCVDLHSPFVGGRAKIAEGIARAGELGDAWLESQALVARLVRPEKDGSALQVTDF